MTQKQADALNTAIASTEMEGFKLTEENIKSCADIMDGKISLNEVISRKLKLYKSVSQQF